MEMKYREISFSDISVINNKGITFSNGEQLLFSDCVSVRKKAYPDSVCVAERDITALPPYFEFFADSTGMPVRIVFDKKGLFSKSKNHKQFHELKNSIEEAGYGTFDLS